MDFPAGERFGNPASKLLETALPPAKPFKRDVYNARVPAHDVCPLAVPAPPHALPMSVRASVTNHVGGLSNLADESGRSQCFEFIGAPAADIVVCEVQIRRRELL